MPAPSMPADPLKGEAAAAEALQEAAPEPVAVRALCDFAARRGDLDLRFTPAPSGAEGVAGHLAVTARRGAGYQRELPLSGRCGGLLLQGRADGWDPGLQRLEEIKTHRGDAAHIRDNRQQLHWAQARVYGWLLCQQLGLPGLQIALVYFDIDSGTETPSVRWHDAAELEAFTLALCERHARWLQAQRAHRAARNAALAALPFPFPAFRTGQRTLAEAVYRTQANGRALLAQAPTGIGKTAATLFAALKAMPRAHTDHLFYLTARTTGRQLALDALARLAPPPPPPPPPPLPLPLPLPLPPVQHQTPAVAPSALRTPSPLSPRPPCWPASFPREAPPTPGASAAHWTALRAADGGVERRGSGPAACTATASATASAWRLPLRVLELVAREKACEHPDKACHGDACPLARGFYDRLPAAREAATQAGWLDRAALREVALAHNICPYYLGQDLLPWCDVAVGDYNHVFDLGAHGLAMAQAHGRRLALLVDEAHNLVERARALFSATLDPAAFQAVRASAPPALRLPLNRLHRAWNALAPDTTADTQWQSDLPGDFMRALQRCTDAIGEHLAQQPGDAANTPLQHWLFEALHMLRLAERFGDHSVCGLQRPAGASARSGRQAQPPRAPRPPRPLLHLRNLVPGPLLADAWAAAPGATLFSATLEPMHFMADLLGLPASTARLAVDPPFDPGRLRVRVAGHISTRWRDRAASLTPMADTLAQQFAAEPGNYLAFFSSFDYLQQALERLQQRHPELPVWAQSRGMGEPDRAAFLARFTEHSQGIGFAVLGGAFGEGIDLPGRRLIGAFIATLGMPQVNPQNEQLRQRLQRRFGQGQHYAYLFPGLQKVVQAAGRVIRSESDHGTVWLMDDRFAESAVRAWLPPWWRIETEPRPG